VEYFQSLLTYARSLDPQMRPITIEGDNDIKFHQAVSTDLLSVHSYAGWYDFAPVERVASDMGDFIESWLEAFPNGPPVIVSEYGAGAIPGMHHEPPIQYSEELQVLIHAEVHRAFDNHISLPGAPPMTNKSGLVGEHVHSFHDFKQVGSTVDGGTDGGWGGMTKDVGGLNWKGLLSRDREPKAAFAAIRERYMSIDERWNNHTTSHQIKTDDHIDQSTSAPSDVVVTFAPPDLHSSPSCDVALNEIKSITVSLMMMMTPVNISGETYICGQCNATD
jgi:beta-glucuronidase